MNGGSKANVTAECRLGGSETANNKFLLITNLTHFFMYLFIYFISLHVSSVTVLIIRRSNCINTSSGMISLCKWQLGMPASWPAYQAVKFLLITNLTHFFMYLFISSLYMFRASQCSSSGDRIVLINHVVWLVCVSDCLVCRPGGRHTKQSLTQTNHTRWCIHTIRSPDDGHCDARNM